MNILSLSGFIPEQICDTIRFMQYPGETIISHYCGYTADYISQVLCDPEIDGAVFPRSCDSCRVIKPYLSDCSKFVYQLTVPARQDSIAIDFFASQILDYQHQIESYYNVSLTDVVQRIELVNERNRYLAQIYGSLSDCSFSDYLDMIHTMLRRPLVHQLNGCTSLRPSSQGKPVYIVGSFLSNVNVAKSLQDYGLKVVGDNLTESKRLFSAPASPTKGNVYHNIAKSILHTRLSPSQNNFRCILQNDLNEILEKKVQGVIFVTQKFCEPYDYLFSVYKKMLDEYDIPIIQLVMSNSTNSGNIDLALETFCNML